eukprot:jgi/Botrbrau1/19981/Bobra.0781s0001.1
MALNPRIWSHMGPTQALPLLHVCLADLREPDDLSLRHAAARALADFVAAAAGAGAGAGAGGGAGCGEAGEPAAAGTGAGSGSGTHAGNGGGGGMDGGEGAEGGGGDRRELVRLTQRVLLPAIKKSLGASSLAVRKEHLDLLRLLPLSLPDHFSSLAVLTNADLELPGQLPPGVLLGVGPASAAADDRRRHCGEGQRGQRAQREAGGQGPGGQRAGGGHCHIRLAGAYPQLAPLPPASWQLPPQDAAELGTPPGHNQGSVFYFGRISTSLWRLAISRCLKRVNPRRPERLIRQRGAAPQKQLRLMRQAPVNPHLARGPARLRAGTIFSESTLPDQDKSQAARAGLPDQDRAEAAIDGLPDQATGSGSPDTEAPDEAMGDVGEAGTAEEGAPLESGQSGADDPKAVQDTLIRLVLPALRLAAGGEGGGKQRGSMWVWP